MDLQKQIENIKAQKPIDDLPEEQRLEVFERAVFLFRKYIGPLSDASSLEKNLQKILMLCRLDKSNHALALILAARAAAQVSPSAKSGSHDNLVESAGLFISSASNFTLGATDEKYVVLENTESEEDFILDFRGETISIKGGSLAGKEATASFSDACKIIDRLNSRGTGQRFIELDYKAIENAEDIEIFDTVHDPWHPSTVYSPKLKRHPTQIIEPSTLAATSYPKATYKPMLPAEAISRGFISDAQFECIAYCLQAVTSYLPGSPLGPRGPKMKGGFIIGDGTGVGKTNEFCGVIMDQWLRGHKRHVIVVERSKHVQHIKEGWEMIGGDQRNVLFQGERGAGESLPARDGIMVTTYALLRDDRRYNALVEWANESKVMEGILVFDEAHNMRNATEDLHDEGSGKNNQSQQGMAGVSLQNDLPKAGVVYASATMATDVYNLGYAQRLGLWGENAPFSDEKQFISEMHNLDEAALEQVCIDLKSAGRYCSRTLSFDGVEYEELEHILSPSQKERFDLTVRGWRQYSRMHSAALSHCLGRQQEKKKIYHNDVFRQQRDTIEAMLSSFSMDTLIQDIHEEIARGNSPVIQISMTGEARTKRMIGDKTFFTVEEYRDSRFHDHIMETFPIHMMKIIDGKQTVVLDANGEPIVNSAALKLREEALELSHKMSMNLNVLDRLYLEFGTEMVAEVTGRSIRMVPTMERGKHTGWTIQERTGQASVDDVKAFRDGRKSILVFSLGAGGTGLSYHCNPDDKNTNRRVHYILEVGRRAESAVQGIGRTHRSGQIQPPIVKLVKSDIPAFEIYTSKTLSKIQKMGALSRGHQHATSNAIFEQRVPFYSVYASRAWGSLINDVLDEKIPGLDYESLRSDLRMEKNHITNFDMVLNRLAFLTDGEQRQLIKEIKDRTEEEIARAVRNGSYNQGLETIRAEKIEIADQSEIVNGNGSKTVYYRLLRHDKIDRTPFSQAMLFMVNSKRRKGVKAVFMRHKVNGRIALGIARESGTVVDLTTPAGTTMRRIDAIRQEPWKVVNDIDEAKRCWELEYENMTLEETSELHMLSGSLLYNWNKLPKTGIGLNRCKTDNGEVIVGRLISKHDIKTTLRSLGMKSNYAPAQLAVMLGKVRNGAVLEMDNNWSIDLPQGETDFRLNVPVSEQTGPLRNSLRELGVEEVVTALGSEFTIKTQDAVDVIQKLAIGTSIRLSGVTNTQGANPTAAMAAVKVA